MKKLKLIIIATIAMANAFGQSNDYTFSVTTGEYKDLVAPIYINDFSISKDVDFWYRIPIGFNFQLYGISKDSIVVETPGYVQLTADMAICAFNADVFAEKQDYQIEGSTGNRILKIQWKNVHFWGEYYKIDKNNLDCQVDFQLWLYEGSNDIEVHIGPSVINHSELILYTGYLKDRSGPTIGLTNQDGSKGFLLSGNPLEPSIIENKRASLSTTPPNGTIYKFSCNRPNITGIAVNKIINSAKIYPNPFHDNAVVKINYSNRDNLELKIMDIFGRTVKTIDNPAKEFIFERDNLVNGIYFYQLTSNKENLTSGKFVIE